MTLFIAGLLLFFVPHMLPILAPAVKARLVGRWGERTWRALYSLLSFAGLILIVLGWREFRPVAPQVYEPPSWGRDATYVLVWVALVLLAVPRSKPGRILVIVKHPMVVGVFYWALGHLLANGDMASVMLFGSFILFVAMSRISEFAKGDPRHRFVGYRSDIIALGVGTAVWLLIALLAHVWLTGVRLF